MENKGIKKELRLLPNYYKKIGVVMIVVIIVTAISIKLSNIEIVQSQRDLYKLISKTIFTLGLFFIAMAKDKIEDELTSNLRLKAMASTFSFAVVVVLIYPFIDLVFNDPIEGLSGLQVVDMMLVFYMVMYYLLKGGR